MVKKDIKYSSTKTYVLAAVNEKIKKIEHLITKVASHFI